LKAFAINDLPAGVHESLRFAAKHFTHFPHARQGFLSYSLPWNARHEEAEMDPVTAVRMQLPLPSSPAQPATDRLTSAPAAQTAPPVTETALTDAVHQPALSPDLVTARLAERDESEHPAVEARAAADAAREAYIKASIAAGVSPLPLP
jgi:hypothetical protein